AARGLEEADPVPGRWRVDDHEVVLVPLLDLALRPRELPDLSDRQQLAKARGRGGEVVEDLAAHEQVAHRSHLELEQQVLAQRVVGVDRDRPQVLGHLDLVEAALTAMEDPRGGLLSGALAHDRALAARRRGDPEGQRDGRLADPALAGHEDDLLVEQVGHRVILPSRRKSMRAQAGDEGRNVPAACEYGLADGHSQPRIKRLTYRRGPGHGPPRPPA